MHSFLLIREYKPDDRAQLEDMVKNHIMDGSREAFITCLFKEITLQLIILICALLFIFFGLPPLVCLCAVPVVIFFLFLAVYVNFFNKAVEVLNERPLKCFVAELHYKGLEAPKSVTDIYSDFVSKQNMDFIESNRMQKKIIGTAAVKMHISMDNSSWIYRVAFTSTDFFKSAGEATLNRALKYCTEQGHYTAEAVASECDEDFRELLTRMGFLMRQIYHKKIIGNSLKVMKAQFGVDLQKSNRV